MWDASKQPDKTDRFAFAQKPFFLWFLSAFALGGISYVYGNYSTCRNAQIADDQTLHKYVSELRARELSLSEALALEPTDQGRYELIMKRLGGSDTHLFADNKSRGDDELIETMIAILQRWRQWPLPSQTKLDLLGKIQADESGYFYSHHTNEDGTFSNITSDLELQAYIILFKQTRDTLKWAVLTSNPIFNEGVSESNKVAMQIEIKTEIDGKFSHYKKSGEDLESISWSEFIHPGYCTRRSIWPF